MPKDKTIVGIDIGTTKVCAAVGEKGRDGTIRIVGVGTAPSKGIKKGVIVNIDDTVQSINTAVERAERTSGHKILSANLTISGGQIASLNNRGVVAITRGDRTIGPQDVDRAIEAARVINIPSNRDIIHAIPRYFVVDGQEGVKNPLGMIGYRLDVEAHIITTSVTSIQNLTKCVNRLGIDVDGIVLEPLASAEAVLTDEEKEMGVVLADIGGGSTSIGLCVDGSIFHTAIIPVGGNHVTNDIAIGLRMPFAAAEEIKTTYATALTKQIRPDETVDITGFGQAQPERVSRSELCEIVEARLIEIFSLIHSELKNSDCDNRLPAGVVLTGGGAQMEGIAELAQECLNVPVRIGAPWNVEGVVDSVSAPAYAATVGLLQWDSKHKSLPVITATSPQYSGRTRETQYRNPEDTTYGKLKEWLRAFLP